MESRDSVRLPEPSHAQAHDSRSETTASGLVQSREAIKACIAISLKALGRIFQESKSSREEPDK